MSIDIFSIFAEDKRMVLYRPEWRKITGSVTATILLQQIIFHWNQNARKPFYKFKEPCGHDLYKPGDSWCEELGFSRKEFDSAIKRIGSKRNKKQSGSSDAPVEYWTDVSRLTYYTIREEQLGALLTELYAIGKEPPAEVSENTPPSGENSPDDEQTLGNALSGLYLKPERVVRKITKGDLDPDPQKGVRKITKPDFPNNVEQRDLTEKEKTTERESSLALALFYDNFPSLSLPELAQQTLVETVTHLEAWKYTISYWQIKGYQAQYTDNMLDYYLHKALPRFAEAPAVTMTPPDSAPPLELDALPAIEDALKQRLEQRINAPSFNTWLRPISLLSLDNRDLTFHVPDEAFVYWLEEHYLNVLKKTGGELLGFEPTIHVTVNGSTGNVHTLGGAASCTEKTFGDEKHEGEADGCR